MAWAADGSTEGQPSLLLSLRAVTARSGKACYGKAWLDLVGFAPAGSGLVWVTDGDTEALRLPITL